MNFSAENNAPTLGARFQGDTLEERLVRYVFQNATFNDAESVVKTMDRYGHESEEHYMFVGDDKGPIIDEAIRERKPKIAFELGAYCGYSAVRFGKLIRELTPGAKYYSFEFNPKYMEIATEIVRFAGLSDVVEFTQGAFSDSIDGFLASHPSVKHIDFALIDHVKQFYLKDLNLMENKDLIIKLHQDTVVVGDNIIYPGTPEYYEYVSTSPHYRTVLHKSNVEYRKEVEDAVAISIRL
ncbi:catechol O-methyltransferase [Syncephalis fuscata]|nr:catechol O-methyltransferase [Syncephalis fuscata]